MLSLVNHEIDFEPTLFILIQYIVAVLDNYFQALELCFPLFNLALRINLIFSLCYQHPYYNLSQLCQLFNVCEKTLSLSAVLKIERKEALNQDLQILCLDKS
jgi:hypothetical protein